MHIPRPSPAVVQLWVEFVCWNIRLFINRLKVIQISITLFICDTNVALCKEEKKSDLPLFIYAVIDEKRRQVSPIRDRMQDENPP